MLKLSSFAVLCVLASSLNNASSRSAVSPRKYPPRKKLPASTFEKSPDNPPKAAGRLGCRIFEIVDLVCLSLTATPRRGRRHLAVPHHRLGRFLTQTSLPQQRYSSNGKREDAGPRPSRQSTTLGIFSSTVAVSAQNSAKREKAVGTSSAVLSNRVLTPLFVRTDFDSRRVGRDTPFHFLIACFWPIRSFFSGRPSSHPDRSLSARRPTLPLRSFPFRSHFWCHSKKTPP